MRLRPDPQPPVARLVNRVDISPFEAPHGLGRGLARPEAHQARTMAQPQRAPAIHEHGAHRFAGHQVHALHPAPLGVDPPGAVAGIGDPCTALTVRCDGEGREPAVRMGRSVAGWGQVNEGPGRRVAPPHAETLQGHPEAAIRRRLEALHEGPRQGRRAVGLMEHPLPVEAQQAIRRSDPDQAVTVLRQGRDDPVRHGPRIGDGLEDRRRGRRACSPGERGRDARQHEQGGNRDDPGQAPPAMGRGQNRCRAGSLPRSRHAAVLPVEGACRSWQTPWGPTCGGAPRRRRQPQANGSCSTMVDSRPGPVDTIDSGQPASSSSARR